MIDLGTRRIPNIVTLPITAIGFGLAASGVGTVSLSASVGGLVLGLLLMLPGYLLGGTGGGDVKLLGALGSVLGPQRIVYGFLYSAIAGGVLALAYATARGRVDVTLRGTAQLVTRPAIARAGIEQPTANNRFPYGPAIAAGCVLAAWGF